MVLPSSNLSYFFSDIFFPSDFDININNNSKAFPSRARVHLHFIFIHFKNNPKVNDASNHTACHVLTIFVINIHHIHKIYVIWYIICYKLHTWCAYYVRIYIYIFAPQISLKHLKWKWCSVRLLLYFDASERILWHNTYVSTSLESKGGVKSSGSTDYFSTCHLIGEINWR